MKHDASERHEPDSFDIRAPLRTLRRVMANHRALVAMTTLATVVVVLAYAKIRPPVYEAEVVLMSEADTDMQRERFYSLWNVFRKDDAKSEPMLVTGGEVLARTMEKLNLGWDDVYHPVSSQLTHWWSKSAIGTAYRSVKHRFFPPEQSPWDLTPEQRERLMALVDFRSGTSFSSLNETYVGQLSVKGPTKRVAEIANVLAETYLELRTARHQDEARAAHDTLAPQTAAAQVRLAELESRLQKLREDSHVYFDFDKEKVTVGQWAELEMQLISDRATLARDQQALAEIEKQLAVEAREERTMTTHEVNPVKDAMRAERHVLDTTLFQAQLRFTADSREVLELQSALRDLDARIAAADEMIESSHAQALNSAWDKLRSRRSELMSEIAGLQAKLVVMQAAYDRHNDSLASLAGKQREMQELMRETHLADTEYRTLHEAQVQAHVSLVAAAGTMPSVRIIERAQPPASPIWPKMKYLFVGALVAGFFLGVAMAWIWDLADGRVQEHNVHNRRGQAPVYGTIRLQPDVVQLRAGPPDGGLN